MAPPLAFTPFTVTKSRAVSYSQSTFPSSVEWARRSPPSVPEKTTPGKDVSAADCAGLHPGRGPQSGGGANQTLLPSETFKAVRPPPTAGSRIRMDAPFSPVTRFPAPSETAAYTLRPSYDIPHWTPPLAPPLPTRVC